jgi:hypothetical protein
MRNNFESNHHIMPRSRGGNNKETNIQTIPDNTHRAIHILFKNQHTLEKIQTIVALDEAILSQQFREVIMELLTDMTPQEAYKQHVFNERKKYLNLITR